MKDAAYCPATFRGGREPADSPVFVDTVPVNDITWPEPELVEQIRRHLPFNQKPSTSHD